MYDIKTDDIDYINFMLGKIGELQAVLSKIEEIERQEFEKIVQVNSKS